MKYALNDGNKVEASKGAKGFCPSCGSELIAKCGEVNVNHWAHKGNRNYDSWWENETDWHRSWKDKFPMDWQEARAFRPDLLLFCAFQFDGEAAKDIDELPANVTGMQLLKV